MLQTIPNMSAAMESSTARKGWISSADERRVPKGPVQVYQCIDQCHLASFNSRELRRRQRPTDRARRPCVRASGMEHAGLNHLCTPLPTFGGAGGVSGLQVLYTANRKHMPYSRHQEGVTPRNSPDVHSFTCMSKWAPFVETSCS